MLCQYYLASFEICAKPFYCNEYAIFLAAVFQFYIKFNSSYLLPFQFQSVQFKNVFYVNKCNFTQCRIFLTFVVSPAKCNLKLHRKIGFVNNVILSFTLQIKIFKKGVMFCFLLVPSMLKQDNSINKIKSTSVLGDSPLASALDTAY